MKSKGNYLSIGLFIVLTIVGVYYASTALHTVTKNSQVALRGTVPMSYEHQFIFDGELAQVPAPEVGWWDSVLIFFWIKDEPADPNQLVAQTYVQRAERAGVSILSLLVIGCFALVWLKVARPTALMGWNNARAFYQWAMALPASMGRSLPDEEEASRELDLSRDTVPGPQVLSDPETTPEEAIPAQSVSTEPQASKVSAPKQKVSGKETE